MKSTILSLLSLSTVATAFNVYQDIFSKPKFNVIFDGSYGPEEEKLLATSATRMRLNDRDYICLIPDSNTTNQSNEEDQLKTIDMAEAQSNALTTVKENKSCLYYRSGYWVYEVCKNQVRQFHQDPNAQEMQPEPNTPVFVLGKKQESVSVENNGDVNYLEERLTGGTYCELINKPRTIDIQYSCPLESVENGELTASDIVTVNEVKTCHYVISVHVPELCKDVAFRPMVDDSTENEIKCFQLKEGKLIEPEKKDAEEVMEEGEEEEKDHETSEDVELDEREDGDEAEESPAVEEEVEEAEQQVDDLDPVQETQEAEKDENKNEEHIDETAQTVSAAGIVQAVDKKVDDDGDDGVIQFVINL